MTDGWMASPNQWPESEQTLGESEGQGSLACCNAWECKESDMTEQLNNKKICSIPLQGMK